jgi:hypothetical protein
MCMKKYPHGDCLPAGRRRSQGGGSVLGLDRQLQSERTPVRCASFRAGPFLGRVAALDLVPRIEALNTFSRGEYEIASIGVPYVTSVTAKQLTGMTGAGAVVVAANTLERLKSDENTFSVMRSLDVETTFVAASHVDARKRVLLAALRAGGGIELERERAAVATVLDLAGNATASPAVLQFGEVTFSKNSSAERRTELEAVFVDWMREAVEFRELTLRPVEVLDGKAV